MFVMLLLAGFVLGAALSWGFMSRGRSNIEQEAATARTKAEMLTQQLEENKIALTALAKAKDMAETGNAQAEMRASLLEDEVSGLKLTVENLRRDKEQAERDKNAAMTEAKLANARVVEAEKSMQNWKEAQEQNVQMARASVMQVGAELSSKLLEDHKREMAEARKAGDEAMQKTTENMNKEFATVVKSVAAISDQVKTQRETVDVIWKSLTVPADAGSFAEFGLENCFKSFGFESGRDFIMQYALPQEQGGLRPDALLFLPHDTVMVVDSKTSIHLPEIAASDASEESQNKLKRAMREHLRILSGRDYSNAVTSAFRAAGRGKEIKRLLNVMYLPTEAAVEHIKKADPEFMQMCVQKDIIPAGPVGLASLMMLCREEIGISRQAESHEQIVQAVQDLLESIALVLGHANAMGRGLKNAADSFSKFVNSANSRLLPRSKKLVNLGIRPAKNKELPPQLNQLTILEETHLLTEAETAE